MKYNLFEIPIYVMTQGLEGTADIKELHEIAEELDLLPRRQYNDEMQSVLSKDAETPT